MDPIRAVLVATAFLLVAATLVPASAAAPPPEGVCGICGSQFERAAQENGVNATVDESSLAVRVTTNGTSHWTASATLDRAAADRFAENRTLLEHTVSQTYTSSRTVVDEPSNFSVTLDDRTVTTTFTVPDATRQYPGGVLLFEEFVSYPPNGYAYVDADTLTVEGPSNTTITHAPPGGSVTENRVRWTVGDADRTYSPQLGHEATVAFAPNDGLVARAATAGAVQTHEFEMIEPELRTYATIPAAFLALVAAGLLLVGDRLPSTLTRGRTVARWVAAGAGLYLALTALSIPLGDDVWFVLVVVGIGLVPQALLTAATIALTDRVDAIAGGNLTWMAAVAVLAWTLALLLGAPLSATIVLVAAPLVFLPFGILAGVRHPARSLFPIVAALGPIVATLPFVPASGLRLVTPAMLTVLFVVSAVLGVPLFAIGRQLGRDYTVTTGNAGSPTSSVG